MTRWSFLRHGAAPPDPTPPSAPVATPTTRLTPPAGFDWRVSTYVQENERVTDLKVYGFRQAGASNASVQVLKTVIGWLYHNKITVDDAYEDEERNRVVLLKDQCVEAQSRLSQARYRREEIDQKLEFEQEKLVARQADLAAVQSGDPKMIEAHGLGDRTGFFIATGILVLLTIYLFLFYVSAIYNAFIFQAASSAEEGLRTGRELSVTIFNGQAFQKAWASGAMTFVFLASAPSIVIGMGYLIHHFEKQKRWAYIVAIVSVTLLFDILLAYEIVYQIHRIKILTGETQLEWSASLLRTSPEFYIIIMAGFVVYVMWGLILQVVLEGIEKFHPARIAERTFRHAIKAVEAAMERLQQERRDVSKQIVHLEGELNALQEKCSSRALRNNSFGRHIEEMMHGWLEFISHAYPNERAEKEAEAQRVRTETVDLLMKSP